MATENLADIHGIKVVNRTGGFEWGRGNVAGCEIVIVHPLTFMNLSGKAARAALKFFNEPLESLLVVYDDCAIPTGKIRLRKKGSSGGHNGIASIIECVGSKEFPRLRMGVGPIEQDGQCAASPGRAGAGGGKKILTDLSDYVLSPFLTKESELINDEINRAVSAIETVLISGIERAMNLHN